MQRTAGLTPTEDGGFVALNPETVTTSQSETVEEAHANRAPTTSHAMKLLSEVLLLTTALVMICPCSAQAQIACTADFSAMGQGRQRIEINGNSDGSFDAVMNGVLSNRGGRVIDELIRPHLNLKAEASSSEFADYNSAERSLVHLHSLLSSGPTSTLLKISLDPAQVRRMRTFDLIGKTDKFGGHVLLEAIAESGKPLGRVVRRILVVGCD